MEGLPLGVIASGFGEAAPADLRRNKGWIGTLLERELGAVGGSQAEPDFPQLGVELKSIPVNEKGSPTSSTWVSLADIDLRVSRWEDSWACRKLSRVLWVPVITPKGSAPGERCVGRAVLWSPSVEQDAVLREDWDEHMELLGLGAFWQIDATRGTALQLRPKAAKGSDTQWALSDDGEWVRAQPKGFYLRRTFTRDVLAGCAREQDSSAP
ncbi:MAG: DNA mismatch repair protein MutH [Myxococcota bacterium]